MSLRSLLHARHGSVAVEFAILAPLFLLMLLGIIEGGRIYWMAQSLNEVAFSTARCMAYGPACDTLEKQRTYAIDRATSYRIKITATQISVTEGEACSGNANAKIVTITTPFESPATGLLPWGPINIVSRGCFATLS